MISRQLDTAQEPQACDVCGRSLLRGEQANVFFAGGGRRTVCELCTSRAAHEGWIREGADAAGVPRPRGGERARSLVGRMRQRLELPQRDGERSEEDPASPPPEPRRVHAVPTNAELKVSRALELFNLSEHTRTVAGVARSLGPPSVCAHAVAGSGSGVEVIIAWELCWYRYEIDLAEEGEAVRLNGQGDELAELGEVPPPNAAADERGELLPA